MIDDKIFSTLLLHGFNVEDEDIERFHKVMNTRGLPSEFIFETQEGVFKVNRKRKEFRIVKRKYFEFNGRVVLPQEIDYTIMAMYKIASWSGYKVFLDEKYSN
jgi:hypothetical protein